MKKKHTYREAHIMLHVKYMQDLDVKPASKNFLLQTDFDCGSEVIHYNNIQIIVILRNDIKCITTNIVHQTFPVIELMRFHWKNILYQ
jgi:hypothetical protein